MTGDEYDHVERAILSWLDQQEPELLAFAAELIATPSPNPPGDERAVAAVIVAKLRHASTLEHFGPTAASERDRYDGPSYRKDGSRVQTALALHTPSANS
jgi:hypothetical protein